MSFYATIARYYDAENHDKTDDLAFYSELAAEYGAPVLDIGSGTGRVMLHLAQEGHEMHGIERETAMLARAERKRDSFPHLREKLVYHKGDVFTYALERQFPLVLMTYNALTHFHEQDQQIALLRRLRGWTAQDGVCVFDLPNAGDVFASEDTDAVTLERTFVEPESGHIVMQQSVSSLDRAAQRLHVTWMYDEIGDDGTVKRTFAPMIYRYFFLAELTLLLQLTGFEIEAVYGDYDQSDFGDGSPRMLVIAR